MNAKFKTEFKLENVRSVYSGIVGKCMCGCSGNHRYAAAHRAEASKDRGYVVTDEDVSDRSVKGTANKITRLLAEGAEPIIADDGSWIGVDTETRSYVAYFVDAAPLAPVPLDYAI